MCVLYSDVKPDLRDLQCMTYTNKHGVRVDFRLMDRIKPRLIEMAIALGFPQHVINILREKPKPVFYLLSEWLEGRNPNYSSDTKPPLTWATLISALQHAGLMEEVEILEQHFIVRPVATVSQTSKQLVFVLIVYIQACTYKIGLEEQPMQLPLKVHFLGCLWYKINQRRS